jgi:MFS family permease/quinol monooxygenase YgiN
VQENKTTEQPSAWQPLRNKLFMAVWLATLASNIGTWMHSVGASWMMTSLSANPIMVALVQTVSTAPIVLLALPAGALADIADRRRYLLGTQIWMFLSALGLSYCTWQGITNDWLLIGFTFLLGCGSAMSMPAWSAVTPELVPKKQMHAAITLNGLGMNVSRAIGPAIAGYLISLYGVTSVFFLNAVSFLAVIAVLVFWKRTSNQNTLPAERFLAAIRSGLRYARYSSLLPSILMRGAAFFVFAGALWALLPILVSDRLHSGASIYGILLACIGIGAVACALILPTIRQRIRSDNLVRFATLIYGGTLAVLATQNNIYFLSSAMLLAGACWIAVMASLQVAAQASLPDWVRARGLSVFMMVFMGGMAVGSLIWGYLAKRYGLEASFLAAAGGLLLGILGTWRYSISGYESIDFTPSQHWPLPIIDKAPEHDQGPVMVTIEYNVDSEKLSEFHSLTDQLQKIRKRDGAYYWDLYQDTAQADHYIECFMVESWLEHLRQHGRVSVSDKALQEKISASLVIGSSKTINHYVAARFPK